MKANLSTTSKPWEQIADMWSSHFASPSRISKDETKKYESWLSNLSNGKKKKALILGATPEIREILYSLNFEITILDINLEMILAMNSLLSYPACQDRQVCSNWLDNALRDNYFDFVIGDAVLPNIPWDKREPLLNEITRLLKIDGHFITRAFNAPDKPAYVNIDQLFNKFSKKEPTKKSSLEFVLELQLLKHDYSKHLSNFLEPKKILSKYHTPKGFTFKSENLNKIAQMTWDFWLTKLASKEFIYATREQEESQYDRHFEILESYIPIDHDYASITPMYLLKPKHTE